ncbi:STAS domain-containing protein [Oceanidesulfovibrio marinus]|uniref:Anti-sigma factor antagonist n=1 Tax=Oceanidesulfovibrio marinus TaxID=370038 RepID=A0ABX6NM39_9BACT|nr:STAS domain-containing protein [Oceanidesulfovibrio marinus]QJT10685.1 STAS domain-containing protein [Oceanidesulfovibrio marinus]
MTPPRKSRPKNTYSIEIKDDTLVIQLEGEVTLKQTPDLKQEMVKALDRASQDGVHEIVVDLSNTSFMDSTGISSLVVLRKRSKELNVNMRLTNPSLQVRKILSLVQLTQYFNIEE